MLIFALVFKVSFFIDKIIVRSPSPPSSELKQLNSDFAVEFTLSHIMQIAKSAVNQYHINIFGQMCGCYAPKRPSINPNFALDFARISQVSENGL